MIGFAVVQQVSSDLSSPEIERLSKNSGFKVWAEVYMA